MSQSTAVDLTPPLGAYAPPAADEVDQLVEQLQLQGVTGVQVGWVDNAAVLRTRTIPLRHLPAVARRGIGITPLFSVFNSYDLIDTDYHGQTVPDDLSAEVRLVPVLSELRVLARQPEIAFAPARILARTGECWAYDPRSVLERVTVRAADAGYTFKFGYEIEFFLGLATPERTVVSAHHGPGYSFNAADASAAFVETVLADAEVNGLRLAQIHAEYGLSQLEISTDPLDPVATADQVLLARVTLQQAARAHGLVVSFSPLIDAAHTGNGTHVHTSVWHNGQNLLSVAQTGEASATDDRVAAPGAHFIAGLVEHLPAVAAVGAPSAVSYLRRRPGYFAGAYRFWGIENREASVRFIQEGGVLSTGSANVEIKPIDITGNPYLTIAAVIAAGLDGLARELPLREPVGVEPGSLSDAERAQLGIDLLPTDIAAGVQALRDDAVVVAALGRPLVDALSHVHETDARWGAERSTDEVVAAHLWTY